MPAVAIEASSTRRCACLNMQPVRNHLLIANRLTRLPCCSKKPLLRACRSMRVMWSLRGDMRSEEHTSELQSLMRISYAVFCLKKKNNNKQTKATLRRQSSLKSTRHYEVQDRTHIR